METAAAVAPVALDSPEAFLNRELSWLAFARRVLELAADRDLPLLERVKFAGIHAMLHDEFFMKRMGGLLQQVRKGSSKRSVDGRTPLEEVAECRDEIREQMRTVSALMTGEIRPALESAGIPILDWEQLDDQQRAVIREDFEKTVLPILTPLAIDAEHPFPFISGQGLDLVIEVPSGLGGRERLVLLKVPSNRPRWVAVPGTRGSVPLEQVIAANLDLVIVGCGSCRHYKFRVTRAAEGDPNDAEEIGEAESLLPGSIVRQVTRELKARRFAGVSCLKVSSDMPESLRAWLIRQLGITMDDVYPTDTFLELTDLMSMRIAEADSSLLLPPHEPADHPRLRSEDRGEPGSIFAEIAKGDILLHHPYHSFETSVVRFIEEAAEDPCVLAIKLTIYRTSRDSPIIRALADAARRGKQVAVLVEITARFDEAPNIAWGQFLEREGVHVCYGVEKLKTHVKLALVVRDEAGKLQQFVHVGTGNYHTGTARIYEDVGLLTSNPALCHDVAMLFNQLTAALRPRSYSKLIVAPHAMRSTFVQLIRREADNARAGKPSGIRAKVNQLQDQELIRELYEAGRAGVPITLLVRGLCCLRPGVPGLSENIRVHSIVGRFLEHSRVYEFHNAGEPEYYIGSADWMKRNLDRRVESVAPLEDPALRREMGAILDVYDQDNASRWECQPDGSYVRLHPAAGSAPRASQDVFLASAAAQQPPQPARAPRRRRRRREE